MWGRRGNSRRLTQHSACSTAARTKPSAEAGMYGAAATTATGAAGVAATAVAMTIAAARGGSVRGGSVRGARARSQV